MSLAKLDTDMELLDQNKCGLNLYTAWKKLYIKLSLIICRHFNPFMPGDDLGGNQNLKPNFDKKIIVNSPPAILELGSNRYGVCVQCCCIIVTSYLSRNWLH